MSSDNDPSKHPTVGAEGFSGGDDIFFAAVGLTRMPMIVTDPNKPDNPIVFANAAFLDLTGYAEAEILGRNCRFLQGPETDRAAVESVRHAIEKRTDVAVEILNYRKDGSAFWNALFVSPVFAPDGRLLYFFASQLDVSRRHDAEESLRQSQKMEAVGQLTGGLAHDFNNMLTVIMANLDGALAQAVDGRQQRRLQNALEASQRAARLTSQLLAFARKQRLDGRPTNLNALIGALKEITERTLGSQIEITLDLDREIRMAKVDAVQAEVAILNILLNARDAMPNGGQLTVRTENRSVHDGAAAEDGISPGEYVVLSVTDTGGGMPPEVLAHVMEPFFTTKDVGKGTGMGLAQVYGFMRQSGGQVLIRSEVGEGTTVSLWFPVSREAVTDTPTRPMAESRGGQETILLVEDNPDVMVTAEGILRDYGYSVLKATDGRAAMNILGDGHAIDLLFTDIVMPGGINGVMLAHEAKRLRPGLKVLLTTGWADRALDDEHDRAGFDLIGKPYRRADLGRKVRQVLDGATGV